MLWEIYVQLVQFHVCKKSYVFSLHGFYMISSQSCSFVYLWRCAIEMSLAPGDVFSYSSFHDLWSFLQSESPIPFWPFQYFADSPRQWWFVHQRCIPFPGRLEATAAPSTTVSRIPVWTPKMGYIMIVILQKYFSHRLNTN